MPLFARKSYLVHRMKQMEVRKKWFDICGHVFSQAQLKELTQRNNFVKRQKIQIKSNRSLNPQCHWLLEKAIQYIE